jgi:DNA primase
MSMQLYHRPTKRQASLVEALRAANPIESVVSEYAQLRRSGAELVARCPLHADKTASFYVRPSKGVFHCHGCKAGGDVFGFVRLIRNCSFNESLAILAARAGIEINGFQPSPELTAKAAEIKAQREEEVAFERWRDEQIWAITDAYRELGKAATTAEKYLSQPDAESDPVAYEKSWDALKRYVDFGNRIEREGLLDVDRLKTIWPQRRGEQYVAA